LQSFETANIEEYTFSPKINKDKNQRERNSNGNNLLISQNLNRIHGSKKNYKKNTLNSECKETDDQGCSYINPKSLEILKNKIQKESLEFKDIEKKASTIINYYDSNNPKKRIDKFKNTPYTQQLLNPNKMLMNTRSLKKINNFSEKTIKMNLNNSSMKIKSNAFKKSNSINKKNCESLRLNQQNNNDICERFFNKEFDSAMKGCQINQKNINMTEFSRLLIYLNFLSLNYFHSEIEKKLMMDLWLYLDNESNYSNLSNQMEVGSQNSHMCSVENLRKVLFILYFRPWEDNPGLDKIQKLKIPERASLKLIQNNIKINKNDSPRKGLFDSNGTLWMTKDDKKYLKSHFYLFCINRLTNQNQTNHKLKSKNGSANKESLNHNDLSLNYLKSSKFQNCSQTCSQTCSNSCLKNLKLFNNCYETKSINKTISSNKEMIPNNQRIKCNSINNENDYLFNRNQLDRVNRRMINNSPFKINLDQHYNNNAIQKSSSPLLIKRRKGNKLPENNLIEISRLSMPKKSYRNREVFNLENSRSFNTDPSNAKSDAKAINSTILRLSQPKRSILSKSKDGTDFEKCYFECIFSPQIPKSLLRFSKPDTSKMHCDSFLQRMQKSRSLKQIQKEDILFSKHGVTTLVTSIENRPFKKCFKDYEIESKINALLNSMEQNKQNGKNMVNFYFPNLINNSSFSNIASIESFQKEISKYNSTSAITNKN